ncbi:hypothetical protein Tco_0334974 [Tanacetum coccineum]
MLSGKWTPMNTSVLKFNQLSAKKPRFIKGENDDEHMSRSAHVVMMQHCGGSTYGSNSTASSGSNPAAYQEFMAEQYELDRKAKMTVLERESEDRRRLIQSQRIAEDMRVLQIDTRGMDAADAAIINAQKARIRAAYPPPPN